ncbi:TPA_asm: ash family protein [Salmonella enterica subsp. enterica serovar Ank]|uniref:Ash family protein n=1 Tax=Salmonella enterica subsp. enterica serovar Ank TaxID=1173578 RepID=A0A5I2WW85_SALET|nr:hypothetical protein [Salmonella enterica subsp. enterica serovar Ank]HAE1794231.1 ash family protein [Salmonella enterica subsp. enterica serovar Ank]
MSGQLKKCLNKNAAGCYLFPAATVLAVGRGNPGNTKATADASVYTRVFFIVVTTFFAIGRQIMAWCISTQRAFLPDSVRCLVRHVTMSMVAQAGPLSGGPVSFVSGISTPVWAIASERGNSSDRPFVEHKGDRCHAQIPQKSHPKSDHHPPTQLRLPP